MAVFSCEDILIQTCCSSLYSRWSSDVHLRMSSSMCFNSTQCSLYFRHPEDGGGMADVLGLWAASVPTMQFSPHPCPPVLVSPLLVSALIKVLIVSKNGNTFQSYIVRPCLKNKHALTIML